MDNIHQIANVNNSSVAQIFSESEIISIRIKNASDNNQDVHLFNKHELNHKHVIIYLFNKYGSKFDIELSYEELLNYLSEGGKLKIKNIRLFSQQMRKLQPLHFMISQGDNSYERYVGYDPFQFQEDIIDSNFMVQNNSSFNNDNSEKKEPQENQVIPFEVDENTGFILKMKPDTQMSIIMYLEPINPQIKNG